MWDKVFNIVSAVVLGLATMALIVMVVVFVMTLRSSHEPCADCNYAYILMPNGEVVEGFLDDALTNYNDGSIVVVADNVFYSVSYDNIIRTRDKEVCPCS